MKLKQIITMCALAAAVLGAGSLYAQDNGGGGGNGGGGPGGPGGPGGRRFDPAAMQERLVDRAQDELGFTNDTDWAAVKPLVQKVVAARFDVASGNMGRMFGRPRGGGGDQGGRPRGGFGGPPSPEQDALQKAVDDDVPAGQIKDLLGKYQAAQKAKQDKLDKAQADLRAVLTVKQEASATLMGLLN
jgi:hypothetical protein